MVHIIRYSREEIEKIKSKVSKFVMLDPNDDLVNIYETDKLINLLNIRVEKYDSCEFKEELDALREKWIKENIKSTKEFKVPRHIQNPNYQQVLKFLKEIRNDKATPDQKNKILKDLIKFAQNFATDTDLSIGGVLTYLPDIRVVDNIQHYFYYLMTKYLLSGPLKESIINLVKECFPIQLKYFRSDGIEIQSKEDNSPLTQADQETSDLICARLKELTPNIPILCEETENIPYEARCKHDLIWIVDPLDGTKEFISGSPEFTVNIGLVYKGIPIFGVVGIPYNKEIYFSDLGKGAYREVIGDKPIREKIQVASPLISSTNQEEPKEPTKLRIVISKSHINQLTQEYIDVHYPESEILSVGSSIKLLYVAGGKADAYPRLGPTNEWDICAAHAVVMAAGGYVRNIETGEELEYNKENILNPFFVCIN